MLRRVSFVSCMILFLFGITNCSKEEKAKVIDLSERKKLEVVAPRTKQKSIRVAVGGMITPREGFAYYKKLLNYIEEKIDNQVEFVDREDYSEINSLLKAKEIDMAFVCGGPYVDGHKDFGMELLVAPLAYGDTVYYSYIIVPKSSAINDLSELRGRDFVFTDPMSNTGKLVPTYMLAKMNETPDSFFKKYNFTYAHDKSIKAVAHKLVDGAAVDSLVWEYANRKNPQYTSKTRIITKSPPYGIPPIVVRPGLDLELKGKLKQILLNIHNDEKGQEILKGMMIDKFVEIDDSAYDSIREMKTWLAQQ